MHPVDIIDKKRMGLELSWAEIEFMVLGFTRRDIPDYQMSAWLMAVVLQGMSDRETVDLTMVMAQSGDILDLCSVGATVVDKRSTGGVGDKTTIVVAPLVASLGLLVGKMSGRGLGFSGGTLDKLEAIPGFAINWTREQFVYLLSRHGTVVTGQSVDLAPADGKIYALRDVTATVASLPLIASSIMSKKIAAGASAIVLDLKTGSGAFMATEEDAVALAEAMVRIGRGAGRRLAAVISDMEEPLGYAVRNVVEIAEAIDTLRGRGPEDFTEHALVVATEMLLLAGKCATADEGRGMLEAAIESGAALLKCREWVRAQGGDNRVVDDPQLMPQADLVVDVPSPLSGYVAAIDAREVGLAAVVLGAGRQKKGEPVDHAVGVVLRKKVGDHVEAGEPLLTVHASDQQRLADAESRLLAAYRWDEMQVQPAPLIRRIIRQPSRDSQGSQQHAW